MIVNSFVAGDYLLTRLEKAPLAYAAALASTMEDVATYLYDQVYSELSGDTLQVRTGRLRDALQKDTVEYGRAVTAQVFIGGDVPYARAQERGAQTRPHEIVPREAAALRFEIAEGFRFAAHVDHPGSHIPESMFMRKVLIRERTAVASMIRESMTVVKT